MAQERTTDPDLALDADITRPDPTAGAPYSGPGLPPGRISGRRVVLAFGVFFGVVLGLTLLGAAVLPRLVHTRQEANRVQCGNQLRQVGLGALQYADERGAFPGPAEEAGLGGDPSTAYTPRVARELLAGGYLESADALICPAISRRVRRDPARLAWLEGGPAPAAGEPSLLECPEVSYGWTRRRLPRDASSRALLAADVAVLARGETSTRGQLGNHVDGWNVLHADGSVEWLAVDGVPYPGSYLAKTDDPANDGFLGIRDQADPDVLR